MAEINAKDLTAKTSPATTDSMLLFGTTSNEGAKITVDNMKDWVLSGLSTKTFPNQVGGSSAATILAQLSTLNSNMSQKLLRYTFTGEPDENNEIVTNINASAYTAIGIQCGRSGWAYFPLNRNGVISIKIFDPKNNATASGYFSGDIFVTRKSYVPSNGSGMPATES